MAFSQGFTAAMGVAAVFALVGAATGLLLLGTRQGAPLVVPTDALSSPGDKA